jgi:pimeloyl-ACP methyl ester carboxylesterase
LKATIEGTEVADPAVGRGRRDGPVNQAVRCCGQGWTDPGKEIVMNAGSEVRNVVLVHGGFVDGSGWQGVYDLLAGDGYHVAVVQNPTLSLAGDAAAARLIIDAQGGPVILVGHSYGGAVITEAGTDPNVAALVYIAAFVPDQGESVNTLIAGSRKTGRSRRSCRPPAGSCSWTATSSTAPSPVTCPPGRPRSWPTRRSRGV